MEVLSNVARNVDLNLNDEEKFVCFESKKLAQSHIDVSKQFMLYVTKIYPRKLKNLDVPSLADSSETITESKNMELDAYSG